MCITNPALGQTRWLDVLSASGISYQLVPVKSTFSLDDFAAVRTITDQYKPDIVHGIDHRANAVAFHGARRAKVPMISSFFGWTNWEKTSWRGRLYPIIDRQTMRNAAAVIFDSHYSAGQMSWKGNRPPLAVIHNGVNLERFSVENNKPDKTFSTRFFNGEDVRILCMIGRIHPVKGQLDFLQAAKEISKKYPECRYLIIGDTPTGFESYLETMQQYVSEHNLNAKVCITNVNSLEIPKLLSCIDLFVAPSYMESFSFALIEAMSMSKPVVTTRVGGTPEMIEDGESGLIVEPGDTTALVDAILNLLSNDHQHALLGENALKRVRTEFTVKVMAAKTIKLYRQIIEWHDSVKLESITAEDKEDILNSLLHPRN